MYSANTFCTLSYLLLQSIRGFVGYIFVHFMGTLPQYTFARSEHTRLRPIHLSCVIDEYLFGCLGTFGCRIHFARSEHASLHRILAIFAVSRIPLDGLVGFTKRPTQIERDTWQYGCHPNHATDSHLLQNTIVVPVLICYAGRKKPANNLR